MLRDDCVVHRLQDQLSDGSRALVSWELHVCKQPITGYHIVKGPTEAIPVNLPRRVPVERFLAVTGKLTDNSRQRWNLGVRVECHEPDRFLHQLVTIHTRLEAFRVHAEHRSSKLTQNNLFARLRETSNSAGIDAQVTDTYLMETLDGLDQLRCNGRVGSVAADNGSELGTLIYDIPQPTRHERQ